MVIDRQTWQGIKYLARQGDYNAIVERYTPGQIREALNHACMIWHVSGGTAPLWVYTIKTARDLTL